MLCASKKWGSPAHICNTNTAACRKYDQKGVEEGGYDRADGCNALMPRLMKKKKDDVLKMKKTRTNIEGKEKHIERMEVNAITGKN